MNTSLAMENMKALNESFVQASHKMNKESNELVKNNENVSSLNVSYIELFPEIEQPMDRCRLASVYFGCSNTRKWALAASKI
jgi:hypothetical protein